MTIKRSAAVLSATLALAATAATAQDDATDPDAETVHVLMDTNVGDVVLALDPAKAPITVRNFLDYARDDYYDGTIFHRVIPNFMIQGGGFDTDMQKKDTGDPIANEWQNGLKNETGTIAMARLGKQPDSATSQFFINVNDNTFLDQPRDGAGYAVFGRVVAGMGVVNAIQNVPTAQKGPHGNVPVENIVIEDVRPLEPSEVEPAIEQAQKDAANAMRKLREAVDAQQAESREEALEFVASKGVDTDQGQTTDAGLWMRDSVEGEGEAVDGPSTQVKAHYTLWLSDGTKVQSSHDRGQPLTIGLNQVIKGWQQGMQGMRAGGTRWLIIPPEIGYGANARPGIPANSTLVFKVELVELP